MASRHRSDCLGLTTSAAIGTLSTVNPHLRPSSARHPAGFRISKGRP